MTQEKSQTIVSRTSQDTEITVYTGGPSIVREKRQVTLPEGASQVLLDSLPQQFVPNSLTIAYTIGKGKLKLSTFSYKPANFSLDRIVENLLGKEISVAVKNNNGVSFTRGILKNILGRQLLISNTSGMNLVPLSDNLIFPPEVLESLSTASALELGISASESGEYQVGILYATDGLSWSPRYEVFYDAKSETLLRFAGWVDLTNQTGANIETSKFQLIAGHNSGYPSAYRNKGLNAAPMMASMSAMGGGLESALSFDADSAAAESVGEQKLYNLPHELALAHGETKTTSLVFAEGVPVTPEYLLSAGYYQPRVESNGDQKLPIYVRLRVKNETGGVLGAALPQGAVNIFEPDSRGSLQRTDSSQVKSAVAVGESFTLQLSTASKDLKAQRNLVSFQEDPVIKAGIKEYENNALPIKAPGGPGFGSSESLTEQKSRLAGSVNLDHQEEVVPLGPQTNFDNEDDFVGDTQPVFTSMTMSLPEDPNQNHDPALPDPSAWENAEKAQGSRKAPKPRYRTEVRELVVFNYKDKTVDVFVEEHLPQDVQFLEPIATQVKSFNHNKASGSSNFTVNVPASGQVTVRYSIKYRIG